MVIIFFVISTTLMIIIASMMFYALYKMKKTIEQMPRMKKGINVKRMINHSIAYIIYNSTYLIDTIFYIFGDVERKEEMTSYVAWLIITVAALFS
jgi:high-affinity Fe2+/Pb2+ permease